MAEVPVDCSGDEGLQQLLGSRSETFRASIDLACQNVAEDTIDHALRWHSLCRIVGPGLTGRVCGVAERGGQDDVRESTALRARVPRGMRVDVRVGAVGAFEVIAQAGQIRNQEE